MQAYIAVLHEEGASVGISFPDLPGCISLADSEAAIRPMATEALTLHLAGMREDRETLPRPSTRAEVAGNSAFAGLRLVAVTAD